jgi:nucleoid-associated protein YgaU
MSEKPKRTERDPTDDEAVGIASWWNSLPEPARAELLRRAGSSLPVDAWKFFNAGSGRS